MLTVRAGFCFFIIFGAFKETFSWTIDLPQVRKYVFEKSLKEDLIQKKVEGRVVYDNIHTNSQHYDYEKYRKHSDEHEYNSYMEQKVHDAVRNGSEYLEGLRRAIEDYTRRLEDCRRMNVTANIIQLRPNLLNFTGFISNVSNQNQPTNFTVNLPPNATDVVPLTTSFSNFMNMSANFTMLNSSQELRECMRADQASEHVKRLAQLAIWAANELQDKLYADKYEKHGEQHDDSLILRLAWFLDRLAHLTGYDPKPHEFVTTEQTPTSSSAPRPLSWVPTLISTEDLQFLLTCMSQNSSQPAPERCAMPRRSQENPDTFMSKGWPAPTFPTDLSLSGSENHEYTYSEQDYAEENMPLSLPPRPMTAVKTKRKRSVQEDPLQELFKYYAKYKAWTGSNLEIDDDASKELSVPNSVTPADKNQSKKRSKRFIVIKKFKYLKPENPMPDLSSFVKHKLGVHYNKDKEEASKIKKILEKLNVKRPAKTNLKKHKKSKRSVKYMNIFQPRVPLNPQGDISYYIKNKEAPPTYSPDLSHSGSENHKYTYSEQDYAEENMPLSLPPRPMTAVKTKRKRSVQEDPLQDLFKYYAKYKAWTGSNLEIDDDASKKLSVPNSVSPADKNQPHKRSKRFIVINFTLYNNVRFKNSRPENPMRDLSSFVKQKASNIKKILEKRNVKRPAKTNLKKAIKSKRSVKYMNKFQPRIPQNPQGDISYYIKNKEGTNYDYNVAQAARVRVGLDEVFQNGNIEVVRRYGSNYNPANQQQILSAYARGLQDV